MATPTPAAAKPTPAAQLNKAVDKVVAASKGARKARATVAANETGAQRFSRLASGRLNKALKTLKGLETIGRSPAYEYTAEQAGKLMQHLDKAVEAVRMAFVNRVARLDERVSL